MCLRKSISPAANEIQIKSHPSHIMCAESNIIAGVCLGTYFDDMFLHKDSLYQGAVWCLSETCPGFVQAAAGQVFDHVVFPGNLCSEDCRAMSLGIKKCKINASLN